MWVIVESQFSRLNSSHIVSHYKIMTKMSESHFTCVDVLCLPLFTPISLVEGVLQKLLLAIMIISQLYFLCRFSKKTSWLFVVVMIRYKF